MNSILFYIAILFILIFGGYVVNRVFFWIGAVIWKWSKLVIFDNQYWFDKGTTVKSLADQIKYEFDSYRTNDTYDMQYDLRFIPVLNLIAIGQCMINILGFVCTLLISLLRLFFIICCHVIYPYFIKYVIMIIVFIYRKFIAFCKFIRLNKLFTNLKTFYQKTILKIQNLRIA